LSLLRSVTVKVGPPRALYVPDYFFGFPLGEVNNPTLQKSIMKAAFALLSRNDVPVLEDYLGERV